MSSNEKPKNSMGMLIEAYVNPHGIVPEKPKQTQKPVLENNSREANTEQLVQCLRQTEMELTKAGIELNQLPTDVTKRLFEKYQNIQLHLTRLIRDVEAMLES